MRGGLILEHIKPKDFIHEKLYGSAPLEPVVPIGRNIAGIPIVYQGDKPFCVAATITWIKQYQAKKHPDLSHEYLADIAQIGARGASPSQVLEPARKKGIVTQEFYDKHIHDSFGPSFDEAAAEFRIAGYTRVKDLSAKGLYAALKVSPLAIGVRDWQGVGPHFMAAFDVTADGKSLLCVNWWDREHVLIETVPFKDVVVAYSFLEPGMIPQSGIRAGLLTSASSFIGLYKKIVTFFTVTLAAVGGMMGLQTPKMDVTAYVAPDGSRWEVDNETGKIAPLKASNTDVFGAGYTPVTGYESTLTSRAAAADTSFNVASINDPAGNPINTADISPSSTVRIYLTLEPGNSTREEVVYCTAVSTGVFSSCVRGLNFQGGGLTASTTLAHIHPAASRIIMSNVGVFFREFVSIDGAQRIDGLKTFQQYPRITTTSTYPTSDDELASKKYVDSVGAGGFTAANASTTQGIQTFSGSPSCTSGGACIGVYTSSTASTNGGFIDIILDNASSLIGRLYWNVTSFLAGNWTWSGTQTLQSIASASTSTVTGGYAVNFDTLGQSMATGTAGVPIAVGQALYISSTGTLFLADATQTTTTYPFVGVAQSGANPGQTVLYVRPGGIARGFSSLNRGTKYFLTNTAGTVGANEGTVRAVIGTALTSSTIQVAQPDFYQSTTTNFAAIAVGKNPMNLGWIPNRVLVYTSSTLPGNYPFIYPPPAWLDWKLKADGTSSTVYGTRCAEQQITTTTNGFRFDTNCIGGSVGTGSVFLEYNLGGQFLH